MKVMNKQFLKKLKSPVGVIYKYLVGSAQHCPVLALQNVHQVVSGRGEALGVCSTTVIPAGGTSGIINSNKSILQTCRTLRREAKCSVQT